MNNKKIILVIPVFNGEKYIENTLVELDCFVQENKLDLKVFFVDDGSIDNTNIRFILEKAKKFSFVWDFFSYRVNQGKGYALKYAFEKIKNNDFDYFVFTDVELPYGLNFLKEIENFKKSDLVVGNRNMEKVKQYNFYRKIMSKVFRFFLPKEIKNFSDTQCGIKIFNKRSTEVIFSKIKTRRWVFDLEIFLIAIKNNFKIIEIPVIIKEKCLYNKGGVSILKHGFFILKDLLVIYSNSRKHKYE